jgi:hypothetical protein
MLDKLFSDTDGQDMMAMPGFSASPAPGYQKCCAVDIPL